MVGWIDPPDHFLILEKGFILFACLGFLQAVSNALLLGIPLLMQSLQSILDVYYLITIPCT